MFSSAVLDVVIGLIFCFLTVSLVASAVLEAFSSMLTWRSKDLRQGIQQMVNDPGFTGLALELYQHASINPRGSLTGAAIANNGGAVDLARPPAYIAPAQFATAVMDILNISAAGQSVDDLQANVDAKLQTGDPQTANPQMHTLVSGIVQRAAGNLTAVKAELAAWFDNAMDRLSGAYKRKAQLVSFLVALVLCAILNVDAIRVAHVLWEQPTVADSLKLAPSVEKALAVNGGTTSPNAAGPAGEPQTPPATPAPAAAPGSIADSPLTRAASEMIEMMDQHLPVGWQKPVISPLDHPLSWVAMLFGWLITTVAALFGAPFWFDTLQSIVRLKGAGPSPAEKVEGRAASA